MDLREISPQIYRYLWARKNGLNFGIYLLLGQEDTISEKLQHYNSSDLTSRHSFDCKQTNADNK